MSSSFTALTRQLYSCPWIWLVSVLQLPAVGVWFCVFFLQIFLTLKERDGIKCHFTSMIQSVVPRNAVYYISVGCETQDDCDLKKRTFLNYILWILLYIYIVWHNTQCWIQWIVVIELIPHFMGHVSLPQQQTSSISESITPLIQFIVQVWSLKGINQFLINTKRLDIKDPSCQS